MNKKIKLLILTLVLLTFFSYLKFRQDDAYIFYTYARNIADGHGYVFNIGEKVNATTSPLYTLLLAFLYFFVKHIYQDSFPFLGNLIAVFSLIMIIFFMSKMIKDRIIIVLFPLILFVNPMIKYGFGMETFLNLAFIICSIYMFTRNKYIAAFFFAALSVLARIDSILFAVILFSFYTYKNKKLPSIKLIIIFLTTLALWFVFSILYFDSFLPTTIAIKLSQHKINMHGEGMIFLRGFLNAVPGTLTSLIILITGLMVSLIVLYIKKINPLIEEGFKILFLWSFAVFIIYALVLNAPPYQWYYTPFALPLSLIFAQSLSTLVNKGWQLNSITLVIFLLATVLPIKTYYQGYNPKYSNYANTAEWLNKNVESNTVIAVDEVGILGYYYKNGKIIDALGLITPEVVPHLSQKDFGWYLTQFEPSYIVIDYPKIQIHMGKDDEEFKNHYLLLKILEARGEKVAIYKKNADKSIEFP